MRVWTTWTTLFRRTDISVFLVSRAHACAREADPVKTYRRKPVKTCLSAFVHGLHLSLGSRFTTRGGMRMAEINATPGRVTSDDLNQVATTLKSCHPRTAVSANAAQRCHASLLTSTSTTTHWLSRRTSTSAPGLSRSSRSTEDYRFQTSSGVISDAGAPSIRRTPRTPPHRHKKVAALVRPLLQRIFDRIPVAKRSIRSVDIHLEGSLDGSKDPATAMSIAILDHDLLVAVSGVSTHFRRGVTS